MSSQAAHGGTRGLLALLLFVTSSTAACAQTASAARDQVYSAAVVDSIPRVVWAPPMQYPDSLRRAGIQGQVVVQLIVDTLGLPEVASLKTVSASRSEFSDPALAMARGMVFRPAESGGHKVRVLVRIPIDFTLTPRLLRTPIALWATDSTAPCTGLTVGWRMDAARLQALVGSHGTVVAGPDGRGLILLFATTCSRTTIDGNPTGPIALGAAIIRLQPKPDTAGAPKVGRSAVPFAYGPAGAPVTGLFQRYGYAVATGPVSLHADSSGGTRRASFVIETPEGRVEANAVIGDSTSRFSILNSLVSTDSTGEGMFAGPEWSNRRTGTATVQATGRNLLTLLGITTPPDVVAYDTGFGWRFTFSRDH